MTTLVTKRFNSAGTVGVNGVDFNQEVQLRNYINGLDLVATDQSITVLITGTLALAAGVSHKPLSSDNTRRVVYKPDTGVGVNDLNRSTFAQGSSGAAISFTRSDYNVSLGTGVDVIGMRILISGSGISQITNEGANANSTYDNIWKYNRIYDSSINSGAGSSLQFGVNASKTLFTDNLVVVSGPANRTAIQASINGNYERNTFVALSSAAGNSTGLSTTYGSVTSKNNLFLGFNVPMQAGITSSNNFSNTAIASGVTSGVTVNTTVGALVVNATNDFRPTANGPLINAASVDAKSTNDILGNNRGPSPDAGAWQLNPFSPSPTGTVTKIDVVGQSVTITGTTANTPTSGMASLSAASVAYNGAVAQAPKSVTLATGTFTVTFDNVPVGLYTLDITLSNAGGANSVSNPVGNANVVGATGTLTSQTLDGQSVVVSGTTSGNPTSATIIVPAAATNPNGATTAGPVNLTLNAGTFDGSIPLTPGNYDPPIIRFTTAAGTSLPISGTAGVSILGIQGNPEAPQPTSPVADTTDPVLTGTVTASAISQNGATISWPVGSDNVGVVSYEYSTNGTTYTNVGNTLSTSLGGLTAGTQYTVYVRAVDGASRRSSPITGQFTTAAFVDTTPPNMTGVIAVTSITDTSFIMSWSAATDNVGVVRYEYSLNGGATYVSVGTALSATVSGLVAGTTYTALVRAVDAAESASAPLTVNVTTTTITPSFTPSVSRTIFVKATGREFAGGKFWDLTDPKRPHGIKDPESTIDITFDWSDWLADMGSNTKIDEVTFLVFGVENAGSFATNGKATIFVSGGSALQATITCRIKTNTVPRRIDDRTVTLDIEGQ